jgi:hypothetical protein
VQRAHEPQTPFAAAICTILAAVVSHKYRPSPPTTIVLPFN